MKMKYILLCLSLCNASVYCSAAKAKKGKANIAACNATYLVSFDHKNQPTVRSIEKNIAIGETAKFQAKYKELLASKIAAVQKAQKDTTARTYRVYPRSNRVEFVK